jgi:DNA invertase Pin-like site-specific DNA recombinase
MRIGYIRALPNDQSFALQRDILRRSRCSQIYEEIASSKGTASVREACLNRLQREDTLIVWRLDRLGRNLGDLVQVITKLTAAGIRLESLTEKLYIDDSHGGKPTRDVFLALVEFERNLMKERALVGLKAAHERKGGRPKKLKPEDLQTIDALLRAKELSVGDVARRFRVSRSTLYRNSTGQSPLEMAKDTPGAYA